MIYLGIDPGTTRIGYGVIDVTGSSLKPLAWGIFENAGTDTLADKASTHTALHALIATWKPAAAGIERLFFMSNKKSAMQVAEMRGILLLAIADHSIPVHEFTPLQVKQRICGHGQAKKPQIQKMVRMLLGIREEIRPDDAADALALAICCSLVSTAKY